MKKVEWFDSAIYWPSEIPFGESVPGYSEKLLYPMKIVKGLILWVFLKVK